MEIKQELISKHKKVFCEFIESIDFELLLQIKASKACSITQYNGACLKLNKKYIHTYIRTYIRTYITRIHTFIRT